MTEQKPIEGGTPDQKEEKPQKMVPLSDVVAIRSSAKKQALEHKAQLEEANNEIARLREELQVAKVSGEDDDTIKAIQAHLLTKNQEVEKKMAEHQKVVSAFKERERALKAGELVAAYKQRGVELDVDSLLAEDDMEEYVQRIYVTHLEAQVAEKPSEPKPQVFESTRVGVNKKMPSDMDPEEFVQHVKNLKREASLR